VPRPPRPGDDRLLAGLDAACRRLREVAEGADPEAVVPSCPDWTLADLVRHVGEVFLHKTACIVEGKEPEAWPPPGLDDEDPVALLDRAFAGLWRELTGRDRAERAGSWYEPDQTVGFWVRRMAHEAIVHRIDAELAAGLPVQAVDDDLALDGIDELLEVHLAHSVAVWGSYFAEVLDAAPPHTYELAAPGASWHLATAPGSLTVADGGGPAEVHVTGRPTAVLRWAWQRGAEDEVEVDGPATAVAVLRACIAVAAT